MKSVTSIQNGCIFDTIGRIRVKLGTLVENQFLFRMVYGALGESVENRARRPVARPSLFGLLRKVKKQQSAWLFVDCSSTRASL